MYNCVNYVGKSKNMKVKILKCTSEKNRKHFFAIDEILLILKMIYDF